mgnify:CR=1 FL=1
MAIFGAGIVPHPPTHYSHRSVGYLAQVDTDFCEELRKLSLTSH